MNVKYVLSLVDVINPRLTKVFEEGQTKVYENNKVLPRAYFVEKVKKANSENQVAQLLFFDHL